MDVRLSESAAELAFEVHDDGQGFDATSVKRGSGLQGMGDRLAAVGGAIELRSSPGAGTMVRGRVTVGGFEREGEVAHEPPVAGSEYWVVRLHACTPAPLVKGVTVTDPLADLLLDANEVDRARLAQGLAGILGIDNETGRIVLKPRYNEFDSTKKVLTFLLGALASSLLGKRDSEAVAPSEIQQQTGMPKGTVNPKLSQLAQLRLVSKTGAGAYYVAPHQIEAALDAVRGGD